MLFPYVSFVLEVVGACLLAVVIVYVAILNRRLSALRADKAHLQQLIVSFNESTSRAEAGIGRMRASAEDAASLIQARVGDARQLHEELAYLVERATGAADRLEKAIGTGRAGRSDAGRADSDDTVALIRPPSGQMRAAESVEKAGLWRSLKGLR